VDDESMEYDMLLGRDSLARVRAKIVIENEHEKIPEIKKDSIVKENQNKNINKRNQSTENKSKYMSKENQSKYPNEENQNKNKEFKSHYETTNKIILKNNYY